MNNTYQRYMKTDDNQINPYYIRNAMFDMAFNQTTSMVQNQLKSYTPEAKGLWNSFKYYFQVSNQYVIGKLKVFIVLIE